MPSTFRIYLFEGKNGRWYFRRVTGNGEVIGTSQGYKERKYAREAIRRDFPGVEVIVVKLGDE